MFTRKDLVRLLVPLIMEQILAVLVGMVDVVMVAAVGEAAISDVSLMDSIGLLIIQLLAALATGGSAVCSQYLGKKKPEQTYHAAGQLLLVTTAVSVVIASTALVGNRHLLDMIFGSVEEEVMRNAMIYFWISALSYPFLAVYNSCVVLYRSMGNSKVSMYTSLVVNGLNIAGNAICISGLHMGVEEVAIPIFLFRAFVAVLMMYLTQRPANVIRIHNVKELRFDGGMIKNVLWVGVPNGMENAMFWFGKLFLQSLVSSLGTAAIASCAVAGNLMTFEYLPGNVLGLGLIIIVGQCMGAGEWEQAKKYTKKLVLLNYVLLAFTCTLMVAGCGSTVGIYNLSSAATAMAKDMILAHSLAMIIWPLAFILPYSLRASFDASFAMYVLVASMWIFWIGFACLLVVVWRMGMLGIWYDMFIDWAFRALAFIIRFRNFGKRKVRGLAWSASLGEGSLRERASF